MRRQILGRHLRTAMLATTNFTMQIDLSAARLAVARGITAATFAGASLAITSLALTSYNGNLCSGRHCNAKLCSDKPTAADLTLTTSQQQP